MSIDDLTIEKLEDLAMLRLEANEKKELKADLEKLIDMFNTLAEVNTEGVLPLKNIHDHEQPLREDKAIQTLSKSEALSNSIKATKDYFVVPKVIKLNQ